MKRVALVCIGVGFFAFACGGELEENSYPSSISTTNTIDAETKTPRPPTSFEDLMSPYTCQDSDPTYQQLINTNQYSKAITHICHLYNLDCNLNKISINLNMNGMMAYTNALTDHITVGKSAFHYENCHEPNSGWLGAIVAHEIFHTKQSKWDRYWATRWELIGITSATAKLEIDAWQWMLNNANHFKLNTSMKIYIDTQISEYYQEL